MKQAGTLTLVAFSLTLFLSASIMFAVQPMTGKMLLPLVGGTPAGWVVAMAFFQVMLLLGYFLAHALSKLDPYKHAGGYIACLLLGAFFLPVAIPADAIGTPSAFDVFRLLASCVAVPFIALSATSSTIQRLFTVTGHSSAGDPYFLYMASNLGSFAGLLLYPLVIEPRLDLGAQSAAVSFGYTALIGMVAACLAQAKMLGKSAPPQPAPQPEQAAAPGTKPPRWRWLALSFVPSSLLLGVTTYITTDVISAPMIWVLPLALYLLTFVIAFAKKPLISLKVAQGLQPYAISAAVLFITMMQATWLGGWMGVVFYLLVFGAVALACHLQLASLRSLGSDAKLTEFYLMLSLGGALGGVLNAFIIPNLFNRLIEFPLMLLASFMLHPAFEFRTKSGKVFVALLVASVVLVNMQDMGLTYPDARLIFSSICVLGIVIVAPLFFRELFRPVELTLAMLVIFIVSQFAIADERFMVSLRNFYGTIRVYDNTVRTEDDKIYTVRTMRHGSTIHGTEVQDFLLQTEPTTYYARSGPLGDIFETYHPKNVAAVGLGAGAVNCYYKPDRAFTFFELDPDVVKIAERDFSFLDRCPSSRKPTIYTGDGRLEMAKRDEKYDLIVMDAFTSDSIPTHLLTKEAFELYFKHLNDDGVLSIHISNRYFQLWDAITSTAATLGMPVRLSRLSFEPMPFYATPSIWMVIAKPKQLQQLDPKRWRALNASPEIHPWTDSYSDLFDTLVFTRGVEQLK